ncbi:hypothetical protein M569_16614, partial [Genlisea aurea]
ILAADSSVDTFLYGGCARIKYSPNSAYEWNLNSLLASLVNSATYSAYNKFTIVGPAQRDVVNGVFQCRGDLSVPDCAACVAAAVARVGPLCPEACGGAVQLEGCYVKYDNLSFLGVEDKAVAMKNCGPAVDGFAAAAEMSRRDAVLAALGYAGGSYRVGGAEAAEGVAQCVGDLSAAQCQDCLTEAIRRLKQECGGASSGDMFLGKCYARYTTGGAQNYRKSNHDSHSDSEKTFAIIIGLLAGVALLIIFLAFLGRIFNRNGE